MSGEPEGGPEPTRTLHSSSTSTNTFTNKTTDGVQHALDSKGADAGDNIDTSSEASDDDDRAEMNRRHSIVQQLATQMSRQQTGDVDLSGLFSDADTSLNPSSPKFNARAWAKALAKMTREGGGGFRRSGFCFEDLNVFGYGAESDFQKDVGNVWLSIPSLLRTAIGGNGNSGQRRIDILRDFDGLVRPGEMLVALGPPGAGCTTFLKTLSGETNGIYVDEKSYLNYEGITPQEMHTHHRGEAIYTAEVDVHFPMLSVGDTLTFASRARCPRNIPAGLTRNQFCDHLRDVVMAMYGISHTVNTRVGNEYIRGVSGGERKRVTISEATLSSAPLQFWDNSTRGLDSANAVEFCKTLRLQSDLFEQTCGVSIYQSPQSAYDLFDKVTVIYEGRQIYFGRATDAKDYFIGLGFECPSRQTTPDFLTSMTAPTERVIRPGWESRVPRTPDEFAACWKASTEYQNLKAEIAAYKAEFSGDGVKAAEEFRAHKRAAQAKSQRLKSPFTLSFAQQCQLCLWRGWKRLFGDPGVTLFALIANSSTALIISSLFYDLQPSTSAFYNRSAVIFVAILANAFSSALEILTQYAQRPIVEKQTRYGFYHSSAEAFSSIIVDMPYKITNALFYNLTLYFMTHLRREPGAFFFFLLVSFLMTLSMSGLFRSIAALSRSLSQAMVPAAFLILALVIFTGFVIPVDYMLGWCRWINYLDPVAYGFEALMINEFHGRTFECDAFVPSPLFPGYEDTDIANMACTAVGSLPGSTTVSGTRYIEVLYKYTRSHKWRNVGILIAFAIALHVLYLAATELISAKKSKGEILVFRRGHLPPIVKGKADAEASNSGPVPLTEKGTVDNDAANIQGSTSVFHWNNVCYDITIKGEPRRILDHVDGWVKPGTLTALMGVSGAGKTTLLDCLADRVSMGVITGEMLVDGKIRDDSFQRKTGYVQQQDLHLETSTVREALSFSALLRQPASTPKAEKLAYVDEVIRLLDMQDYADAVVGVLGEGLNVEQRKRLTIGVELAAKPPLLLFVDEPTSGLDSQTSWAILDLLEKLSKAGQSILCTIHQPSAMLFQRFDRLLFLAKGGRTVYFGDIGEHSKTLTSYFQGHGARPCNDGENPAEWMLEAIGAAPGSSTDVDWHQAWRDSPEYAAVQTELQRLKSEGEARGALSGEEKSESFREFAAPFWSQMNIVTRRVFEQYWRTPSYIYSKFILCTGVALFIGLVFLDAPLSIQGLQNQMFAIFNILTVFGQLVQQQMPHFVTQRSLYEVRERPSKTYSWKVFMLSQVLVEIPWNSLMSIFMFICVYYPVGLNNNASQAGQSADRGALMWLLLWQFLVFTCTFAHACIAITESAEAGGNLANVMFMMCLLFCGVLASPDQMPGFWIFMYRVSPFTYLLSSILSTGLANVDVTCESNELVTVNPPANMTCDEFLTDPGFVAGAGGYLENGSATTACQYCPLAKTNTFLAGISANFDNRWRDFGIGMVYIIFNIAASLVLYWLVRMPKGKRKA
ncbi:ABC-type branched-chain amino acid transport system, ATPase component [Geosmithia morbida]|uniref:ABC-type branched-chain amino acid transport system, ATPase component n=1 Tax=Geosmithia morbida TaxID=1094350 RepID=A0A9P4YWY9_9HYPO|nr:ABC-type branched-chain amino acid transport system, ATPase component [Geosmithia morbida]KAF4122564.1 ABC-type branched-chain amino acid transport system, ATPase component [Geosmithia morbida]